MNISLNGDFEEFIKKQMSTGLYKSVNDIIQEALTLLISKKSISKERIDMFNKEIEEGLKDIEDGKVQNADVVLKKLMSKYE